jgi:hypothetical protein
MAVLGLLASSSPCQWLCAESPSPSSAAVESHCDRMAGSEGAPAPAQPCEDDCKGCGTAVAVDTGSHSATTTSVRVAAAVPQTRAAWRATTAALQRESRFAHWTPPPRDVLATTSTLLL